MNNNSVDLAHLFQAVSDTFHQKRESLNQADPYNGNHGDHMVEIFQIATLAARERKGDNLAEAMDYASQLLRQLTENGAAQVYARGLAQLAHQFGERNITLDDLLPYVQRLLDENKEKSSSTVSTRGSDVLKALLAALSGWQQSESGQVQTGRPLDMGYLFEMGMSYMQAKQRGGSKTEILADAAASASPLSSVPHRYLSGKMAIHSLLEAMKNQGAGKDRDEKESAE